MVEFGLELVADNPNLTFIFFIGLAILAVLGFRFAYYAYRNRAETEIEMQTPIWTHLLYLGVLASLYGISGILEIVTSLELPIKSVLVLATALVLAFSIRQIHFTTTRADGGVTRASSVERVARAVFLGAVFAQSVLLVEFGLSTVTAAVGGLSALAYLAYGLVFYHDQMAVGRLQGTMLDSLLRHLLPVLVFAAAISIVNLATAAGLDRVIVLHVQVVFIIMTATVLMTATIKLRQNLASL